MTINKTKSVFDNLELEEFADYLVNLLHESLKLKHQDDMIKMHQVQAVAAAAYPRNPEDQLAEVK